MVAFDASILLLLLRPDAGVPRGPDGAPVERAADRVRGLVADLEARGESAIIPTPALAEVLVRVGAREAEQLVERLARYWVLRIEPFDARAAIEVAAMTRDALARGRAKGDGNATWAKLKYDQQIVAVAKVHRAAVIYSDDEDIRRIAARADIEVVGVADLPLPTPKAERPSPEAGRPPQMDWLDSE